MSISDEDRERLLSPEEIEAMADDDYDADEDNAAALAEIGRGKIDEDEQDDDDDSDKEIEKGAKSEKTEVDKDDGKASDVDAEKDDEPGDAEKADTAAPAPAPAAAQSAYKSELPADYDEQIKANRSARTDLRKKLNEGEIDADEFDAKLTELEDQRDELSRQKTRAEIATEMQAQAQQNEWSNTINSFIGDAASKPELGIVDYRKDLEKQADLDTFVKALAAVPANADKPSRWFLEEAHKRVVALHSIPTSKKPADSGKRKVDASEVVTTLADVPGGVGDTDPIGDEFAELDKLIGPEYERELAKLSPEKRLQYQMSA
ncbi:hypothetical protein G7048_03520 [Diaphorobacter sp. HDW4B]|uniref:hypothetical protein n=1 Tax=Diaphorobacter sp. HDW4B TaxID=2714925 RepID=UPI001409F72C|nr:hypothetical protein [Diaphorobacter sp. HDW4B]QIL69523.1 hypothetical protein G7048_03520 [Diaphorobacter sp. HDW4B]